MRSLTALVVRCHWKDNAALCRKMRICNWLCLVWFYFLIPLATVFLYRMIDDDSSVFPNRSIVELMLWVISNSYRSFSLCVRSEKDCVVVYKCHWWSLTEAIYKIDRIFEICGVMRSKPINSLLGGCREQIERHGWGRDWKWRNKRTLYS